MEHPARPFFVHGPSAVLRAVLYGGAALVLLLADHHWHSLSVLRSGVHRVLEPVMRVATMPGALLSQGRAFFVTQHEVMQSNENLRQQLLMQSQQISQLQQASVENGVLRQLLSLKNQQQAQQFPSVLGEILYSGHDPFNQKLIINRGRNDGVHDGAVVLDVGGVVGQVTQLYAGMSEVTLITDKDHAVPVEVERNGLRAVMYGLGQRNELEIRHLAMNADIQPDDVLITSGVDGLYPRGLRVGLVQRVEQSGNRSFARVVCSPSGSPDKRNFLLVLGEKVVLPPMPVSPAVKLKPKKGGHRG